MNLTGPELLQLRRITATERVISVRPELFSKEELYLRFQEQMNFMSEAIQDRGIESAEAVTVDDTEEDPWDGVSALMEAPVPPQPTPEPDPFTLIAEKLDALTAEIRKAGRSAEADKMAEVAMVARGIGQ